MNEYNLKTSWFEYFLLIGFCIFIFLIIIFGNIKDLNIKEHVKNEFIILPLSIIFLQNI